jgi:hypothetical protein
MHVAPIVTARLGPRSVFRFRAWLIVGDKGAIAEALDVLRDRPRP